MNSTVRRHRFPRVRVERAALCVRHGATRLDDDQRRPRRCPTAIIGAPSSRRPARARPGKDRSTRSRAAGTRRRCAACAPTRRSCCRDSSRGRTESRSTSIACSSRAIVADAQRRAVSIDAPSPPRAPRTTSRAPAPSRRPRRPRASPRPRARSRSHQIGRPCAKFTVPSIGSTSQRIVARPARLAAFFAEDREAASRRARARIASSRAQVPLGDEVARVASCCGSRCRSRAAQQRRARSRQRASRSRAARATFRDRGASRRASRRAAAVNVSLAATSFDSVERSTTRKPNFAAKKSLALSVSR